ncbi:hypothetical protein P43SY_011293 [Pythium insidiosum]|uniref:Calponin-homology (CH) domain-containing protein n=1 Tax=Pythium insidiosum TaxID=114742 RepID=A0AAD5M2J8_PYTIN|nr:hypothetical protein P43SY_011293 [Pythium insidiosum]
MLYAPTVDEVSYSATSSDEEVDHDEYELLYPSDEKTQKLLDESEFFSSVMPRGDCFSESLFSLCGSFVVRMGPVVATSLVRRFTDARFNWANKTLQSFLELSCWVSVTCATYSLYHDWLFAFQVGTIVGAIMSICDEVVIQFVRGIARVIRNQKGGSELLQRLGFDVPVNGKAPTNGHEVELLKNLVFGYLSVVATRSIWDHYHDIKLFALLTAAVGVAFIVTAELFCLEDLPDIVTSDEDRIQASAYSFWQDHLSSDPYMKLASGVIGVEDPVFENQKRWIHRSMDDEISSNGTGMTDPLTLLESASESTTVTLGGHGSVEPPNVGATRKHRQLSTSADLDGMTYDFAIVTHRPKVSGSGSPEKDGVQTGFLEKLTENGLDVDIIEGDFTRKTRDGVHPNSRYYVLLVRGRHEVLAAYGRRLKFQTWLRNGNTREVDGVVRGDPIVSPADRIQVIDHIIREGAKIRATDPHVHSIFPVHNEQVNEYLLKTFIQTRKLELLTGSFLGKLKEHFVFEVLKVRYPKSGIFSAQWFYILGGGILYGLFVDIFQWNLIVTKAARLFTEWENWKTLEQFEKSMIRKLFLMDFLNYYTWFFLLAFVYKQGARYIIADMEYRDEDSHLTNLSKARFIENDEEQMEKLNAKARDILFQSEQDDYDPHSRIFIIDGTQLFTYDMATTPVKARGGGYGLDAELAQRAAEKYDYDMEDEARQWIEAITGREIGANFGEGLRDGVILCELANKIHPGVVRRIETKSKMPFKLMENVSAFLKACRTIGVNEYELFETVDLFELKDLGLVVRCLHALGRAVQKNYPSFSGPTLGVKEAAKNERQFTEEQIAQARNAPSLLSLGSMRTMERLDVSRANDVTFGADASKPFNRPPPPPPPPSAEKVEMVSRAPFLKACRVVGVAEFDLFETVDLFELKNVDLVVKCIHALGRAVQKNVPEFDGPSLGVKEATVNKRKFSAAQLKEAAAAVPILAHGSSRVMERPDFDRSASVTFGADASQRKNSSEDATAGSPTTESVNGFGSKPTDSSVAEQTEASPTLKNISKSSRTLPTRTVWTS